MSDPLIIVAIHHHLKSFCDQGFCSSQSVGHVGIKRLSIAQHFEFHQVVAIEQLAPEAQGAQRVIRRVAACGIRQDGEARRRQCFEQIGLVGILADVAAANRHRDNLGTAGVDGGARFSEVTILAGANQQARAIIFAADD